MTPLANLLADQVSSRPEALAIVDGLGNRWRYADLGAASAALAEALRAEGVRANDRVLMLSENCAAAVASLFACWQLGAVVIPVNARQTAAEVARILDHATPAAVLLTTEASDNAVAHAKKLEARAITGAFGQMHLAPRTSAPDPTLQDVATLLYTTGTTGDPKGVMLTHANLRFGAEASVQQRSMVPGDVVYGVAPLTHVIGLISVVMATLCAGATLRQDARFSAEALHRAVMEGVTILPAVPQMHALVMQFVKEQGLETMDAPRLRYVSSGGAPLDATWKRKVEGFYRLPLQNGYGMTECSAATAVTANPIGTPDVSVGLPVPGTELRIDDTVPGGNGAGEGEVVVRGPHVMKGYYRNPDETAKVMDAAGWLRTGDLGKIDAAGNLHILGRSKELIIHGGFNVYPPEVEAAINDHPQVIQSAVVGHMIEGDEKVLAFVQVAEVGDVSVEDLRAFVAERLTGYKRPVKYVIATALPAAPTGKLLKHKLKEAFADQL